MERHVNDYVYYIKVGGGWYRHMSIRTTEVRLVANRELAWPFMHRKRAERRAAILQSMGYVVEIVPR